MARLYERGQSRTTAEMRALVWQSTDMTPSLTLTKEELQQLTGYSQVGRQAEWLREQGWVHIPPSGRRGDHARVDRTYYLARMSGPPAPRRSGLRLDLM